MSERTTPRRRLRRLNRSLLWGFLAMALIPAIILTLLVTTEQARRNRSDVEQSLGRHADTATDQIDAWIERGEINMRSAVNNSDLRNAIFQLIDDPTAGSGQARFQDSAGAFIETTEFLDQISLVSITGEAYASTSDDIIPLETDFGSEPWLIAAIESDENQFFDVTPVAVTGPLRDPVDGQSRFYFSMPIRFNRTAPLEVVLVGRADIQLLQDLIDTAIPSGAFGSTGEWYLVREGRQYVIAPRSAPQASLAEDSIVEQALTDEDRQITSWTDHRTQSVIGIYTWVDDLDLSLVIKQDLAEVQVTTRNLVISHTIAMVVIAVIAVIISIFVSGTITNPLRDLSQTAVRMAQGDLNLKLPEANLVEVKQLSDSLEDMTGRLRTMIQTREDVISARTRQLEITAQIGREITGETNLDRLLQRTVDMIRDRLGHYHAQVFMLDDLRQYATLRTSTGRVGQELIARGHKLPVGSQSVVGQAAYRAEPMMASDTRFAEFWMPNPLLPDTRAEVAVPVRLGEEIIGVLDVQDTEAEAFDAATVSALETVADQLAVAVRNAQLFDEKEGLLSASLQLTQTLTRDTWDSYAGERSPEGNLIGYQYDLSQIRPLDSNGDDGPNGHGIRMPISLRGTEIGDLITSMPEGADLSEEQQGLVGQVLDRVALALENARLFEQTQESLAETNRVYEASQRIAAAENVEGLVDELIELSIIDTIDRVAVILLDDPDEEPGERWVTYSGRWTRSDDDPYGKAPRNTQTSRPEMMAIENTPPDGAIIQYIDAPDITPEVKEALTASGVQSLAVMPLVSGGRIIGWLDLQSTSRSHAFDDSDVRFYRALVDQAATALESLRFFEQTQTRARRLQATNDVSQAASSILDPNHLLPLIVDSISEAFGYYHCQVFIVDERGEYAELRASTGEVGQVLLEREHKLAVGSQSVIGRVTATGEAVIARDTDTDAVHRRNELLPNTRAEMAIPLKTGERVTGALDMQSTEPNAFDAEAQLILQSLADEISVTLENAQLFRDIQDRVGELTAVNTVAQQVSRTETLDDLYDVVTTQMMRTFEAKSGFLGVLRGNMIELPIFLEGGERLPSPPPSELGEGLTSRVLEEKRVMLINENLEEEAVRLGARVIGEMPKSLLAVPLLLGEETVGVISIQDMEKEHAYKDAHVRQITTLAAYIAVKIRNAELLDEAQRRAGELGFLFSVTRAAVGSTDLDEALTSVATILRYDIDNVESSMIYLLDETGEQMVPRAAVGYGREIESRMNPIRLDEGIIDLAISEGSALIIDDAQSPRYNLPAEEQTRSAILVPLYSGTQPIGVMTIESMDANSFGADQLRLLDTASSALTAVIQNARLLEEITEANERLQELDKLKSQFLANMSHELRTPLNSIIGFSRVMLKGIDGPLNDLQTQDLTTIHTSGQHLLGLINDILDLSKIEAKMMEIQPEYINMEEIVDGVLSTGRGLVKDKPVDIFKEIEGHLPQVYGDPVRIRQVLLNLVSNAVKFTHEGSVTVRAYSVDPNATGAANYVQIDVVDSGIGIPEDKIDTIFEAFQQADGTTTRQYGGTGLGLPISKNFVELHGGEMWIVSDGETGSTFSFTIPMHPPTTESDEFEMPDIEGDAPVVLAVDDEQGVIDLYNRYLDKAGYTVVGLNSAVDLVSHASELQPSAIVLDLYMPGTDGWAALEALKSNEATAHIPVIICSIDETAHQQAEAGGAAQYLIKPIIEDDLLEALSQATANGVQAAAPASAPAGEAEPEEPVVTPRSILVIEPDSAFGLDVKLAIVASGPYDVRVVNRGFEGLQVAQESRPDAIVIDVDLEDMDGYGLIVSMRSHEDMTKVPIFILTSRELSDEDIERLEHPYVKYLNKADFTDDRLVDGLVALMDKAEAEG